MGLELCGDCGWMHYTTDPCRSPKKSTAARKDVRGGPSSRSDEPTGQNRIAVRPKKSLPGDGGSREKPLSQAGTQAPPVDARKSDRHKPGYWAKYMRDRRAKLKEQT